MWSTRSSEGRRASTSIACRRARATAWACSSRGSSERPQQLDEAFLEIEVDDFAQGSARAREVVTHPVRPSAHEPLLASVALFSREHRERRFADGADRVRDDQALDPVLEFLHREPGYQPTAVHHGDPIAD